MHEPTFHQLDSRPTKRSKPTTKKVTTATTEWDNSKYNTHYVLRHVLQSCSFEGNLFYYQGLVTCLNFIVAVKITNLKYNSSVSPTTGTSLFIIVKSVMVVSGSYSRVLRKWLFINWKVSIRIPVLTILITKLRTFVKNFQWYHSLTRTAMTRPCQKWSWRTCEGPKTGIGLHNDRRCCVLKCYCS